MVHGGMASDVGPILEMVTEKYLLRSEAEWKAREEAIRLFDQVVEKIKEGDIRSIGRFTNREFYRSYPDHYSLDHQYFHRNAYRPCQEASLEKISGDSG